MIIGRQEYYEFHRSQMMEYLEQWHDFSEREEGPGDVNPWGCWYLTEEGRSCMQMRICRFCGGTGYYPMGPCPQTQQRAWELLLDWTPEQALQRVLELGRIVDREEGIEDDDTVVLRMDEIRTIHNVLLLCVNIIDSLNRERERQQ
jgi:hypothetical protein